MIAATPMYQTKMQVPLNLRAPGPWVGHRARGDFWIHHSQKTLDHPGSYPEAATTGFTALKGKVVNKYVSIDLL